MKKLNKDKHKKLKQDDALYTLNNAVIPLLEVWKSLNDDLKVK